MKIRRKKFRDKIGPALFCLIFLAPYFFVSWHFSQYLVEREKRNRSLSESSLQSEMDDFKQSLSKRATFERILKKTEKHLGLTLGEKKGTFFANESPGVYGENTAENIRNYLSVKFGVSPEYVASVGYKGKFINSWFSEKVKPCGPILHENLKRLAAYHTAKSISSNYTNDQKLIDEILSFKFNGESFSLPQNRHVINAILSFFFSGISEFPVQAGACYEFISSKIGGSRVFLYANGMRSSNVFSGGYFAAFSENSISSEFILNSAKNEGHKQFKRRLVKFKTGLQGSFVESLHHYHFFETLPIGFLKGLSETTSNREAVEREKFILSVSVPKIYFNKNINQGKTVVFFLNRMMGIISFGFFLYLLFFGFPFKLALRRKFFLITGLIVSIPFLLIAYFSGLLLQNIDALGSRELESESDAKMFEISRFVKDLGIKRQLLCIQEKKTITDAANQDNFNLANFDAEKRLSQCSIEDVSFYTANGLEKILCKIDQGKAPKRMSSMLSAKYLSALGVLRIENLKVRRELELVGLANGLLDDLGNDYVEGRALAKESQETKDLGQINILHKMNYYLIPRISGNSQQVEAICFRNFFSVSRFGQFFDRIGANPSLILNERAEFLSHRFVLAQRSVEGIVSKFSPSILPEKDNLRLKVEYSAFSKSSGKISKVEAGSRIVSAWKFDPDSDVLIAGISTSDPNLWISYFAWLFPAIMGLFSFISIVLISDILGEFLAKPVLEFIATLREIQGGNLAVRIEMEKTDEFSQLSTSLNSMTEALEQREKLRRFVSEKLFENIQKDHTLANFGAEESEMAILASDIRGFTSLTEKNDPTEIVALLNDYFTEMCQAIVENGGMVERFIGDAVVAIFYANDEMENHSIRAVKAAISMRQKLVVLNTKRNRENLFQIENGIGIVTDRAISAITGSEQGRKVFTVLGKAVARAEELEAMTARLEDAKILVCPETAKNCSGIFSFEKTSFELTVCKLIFPGKENN